MSPIAGPAPRTPRGIRLCTRCQQAPVAMSASGYCFTCWPGGPVTPPPCLRCGSASNYFSNGICAACHPLGATVNSCPDCYAWGTARARKNRCNACARWAWDHRGNTGPCQACSRTLPLGPDGACRLCRRQARLYGTSTLRYDYQVITQYGYQLFFADMGATPTPPEHWERPVNPRARPVAGQLALLDVTHDFTGPGRQLLHERANLGQVPDLEALTAQLATNGAWTLGQRQNTAIALRILHHHTANTNGQVRASDVQALSAIDLPTWTTLAVLKTAGRLIDDRTPTQDTWYHQQTAHLPTKMRTELDTWYDIMKNGSTTRPRRLPRSKGTIGLHLRWALPVLAVWANTGHDSLREISREDIHDALPASGNERSTTGQGLKSIFRILHGQKVLFTNPTVRVKTGQHVSHPPVPVDLDALRAALHSKDIQQRTVVALIAFHGLRPRHLQNLLISDLHDGKLHVEGRTITLAEPVRTQLRDYLDHRAITWPDTANQHLLLNRRTAHRHDPVGHRWLRLAVGTGLTPSSIREDRILSEAHATGGDMKTLITLFGMSHNATRRYIHTVDHSDLVDPDHYLHS